MYKRTLAEALFLGGLMVVSAQQGQGADAPSRAARADARKQLLSLEEEWTSAEDKHDATTLRRILDDKFIAVGTDKTFDKEAFIKLFVGDVDPTKSQALTHDAVIIDGDTAVLVGTDTAHGTKDGAQYTVIYRFTVTYICRHGQWRALAEHIIETPQVK